MNNWFPPNRGPSGLLMMIGSAVIAFVHSRNILNWAYADVVAASAEYRQALITVGIFAAATAAWYAHAVSNPSYGHVPLASERRGLALARSNVAFLSICASVGFVLGLAPVSVFTTVNSTNGGLNIVAAVAGLATLTTYIAAGYLIGCIVPGYLGVPISTGLAYSMLFFSTSILSPVFEFDVISGLTVPTRVSLIRLLFFGGLSIGIVIAAGAWLRMRSTFATSAASGAVVAALAPFVVVVYLAGSYSGPRVTADDAEPVCTTTTQGSPVCVHPAREALLNEMTVKINKIASAAGPTIWTPTPVIDATLDLDGTQDASVVLIQIQGQNSDWDESVAQDLALEIAGVYMCGRSGPVDQVAQDASEAVAAWLLSQTGARAESLLSTPESRQQFEALDSDGTSQARIKIEAQIEGLRQCDGQEFT